MRCGPVALRLLTKYNNPAPGAAPPSLTRGSGSDDVPVTPGPPRDHNTHQQSLITGSDTETITLGAGEKHLWLKRLYDLSPEWCVPPPRSCLGSTAYGIYLIIGPVEDNEHNKQVINLDFLSLFLLLSH